MEDPRDTPELTGSFTVIFPGDLRQFAENPLKAETVFGTPRAIGMGDAFAEIDRLRTALQEIASDPGGYPAEDAFDEVVKIAKQALEG